MKEKLLSVVRDRRVRVAFGSLLLALAAALGLSQAGCFRAAAPTQADARLADFECQVAALEPLVAPILDAEQLVLDLYAGKANLTAVVTNLSATPDEVFQLLRRLRECEPEASEPMPGGRTS